MHPLSNIYRLREGNVFTCVHRITSNYLSACPQGWVPWYHVLSGGISSTRSLPWRGEYVKGGGGYVQSGGGYVQGVLTPRTWDTKGYGRQQAIRIILECFFVFDMFSSVMRTIDVFHCGHCLLSLKSETNQIYCY